jgi:hypothetical protein
LGPCSWGGVGDTILCDSQWFSLGTINVKLKDGDLGTRNKNDESAKAGSSKSGRTSFYPPIKLTATI